MKLTSDSQRGSKRRIRTTTSGGGNIKGVGMLFDSLRGINFGFWSHLGCSGQNVIAVKVSFRVAREKYILSVF